MDNLGIRYITVPHKPDIEGYCIGAEKHPDDVSLYALSEEEFKKAFFSDFFPNLNDHFDVWLDDFEADEVLCDFDFVLAEAEKIKKDCPAIYAAAVDAARYRSGIYFNLDSSL